MRNDRTAPASSQTAVGPDPPHLADTEALLAFVRDLAHDLRAPLTGVLSILLSVSNPEIHLEVEETSRLLAAALRSAQELDGMLGDLLDAFRADAGALAAYVHAVDVGEMIQDIQAALEAAALAKHLSLTCRLDGPIPHALADGRLLRRAASNLVANAIKFTPAGHVILRAWHEPGSVHLTVEDTGPGIPPQVREHVFELFYRGPQASGAVPGTGLGLAFCKRAVAAMGGDLQLDQAAWGGSRFDIRLDAVLPTPT